MNLSMAAQTFLICSLFEEVGEFLPVEDSVIINTLFHSLYTYEVGFFAQLCGQLCRLRHAHCIPPLHRPYVISSSLMVFLLQKMYV